MDAFIYFYDQLNVSLDEVEDLIDEVFSGVGRVTGTGLGETGGNVDIEMTSPNIRPELVLALIRKALQPVKVPSSTKIVIDGREYPFF